jgi:hypothetical protein
MRSIPVLVLTWFALALPVQFAAADDDTLIASAPADTSSGFENVDLLDGTLTGKLGVIDVGSNRSTDNLLNVCATLKNITGHTLKIEAQTLYRDASGNWINGGRAGWITLEIKPRGELAYRSASLTDEAQDYLVRVRLRKPGRADEISMIGVADASSSAPLP